MQGGAFAQKRHVQLQVRASQRQAPAGKTYWSQGVQLDALGAAAVVLVPCPSAAIGHLGSVSDGAYMMSVSAKQVSPAVPQSHLFCCQGYICFLDCSKFSILI